jgi:hypothetical protein
MGLGVKFGPFYAGTGRRRRRHGGVKGPFGFSLLVLFVLDGGGWIKENVAVWLLWAWAGLAVLAGIAGWVRKQARDSAGKR